MHRDTKKESGMFATLIVQLPTEDGYKGGKLIVHQEMCTSSFIAGRVEIDHSQNNSNTFCYSAFFANYKHTLEQVRAGTWLCLSFNLVRRNSRVKARYAGYALGRFLKYSTCTIFSESTWSTL